VAPGYAMPNSELPGGLPGDELPLPKASSMARPVSPAGGPMIADLT
jgi:hypothetical protein